jgi:hypothetical protein
LKDYFLSSVGAGCREMDSIWRELWSQGFAKLKNLQHLVYLRDDLTGGEIDDANEKGNNCTAVLLIRPEGMGCNMQVTRLDLSRSMDKSKSLIITENVRCRIP